FTQPPPRYNEATLVRTLEKEGIGRPSTYATIISTIQHRGYVTQEHRRFFATQVGKVVTDLLVKHFPEVIDVKFTSHVEEELDDIENGKMRYVEVLNEFWDPFSKDLQKAEVDMPVLEAKPTEHKCEKCGQPMVIREGRRGPFLACTGYPKCKNAKDVDAEGNPVQPIDTGVQCEKCGGPMIVRRGPRGPFLGCAAYPKCRSTKPVPDEL